MTDVPFQAKLSLRLTGANWGEVQGNIQDQTDLVDFVDTKLSALGGDIEQELTALEDEVNSLSDRVTDNYAELSQDVINLSNDIATTNGNVSDLDDKVENYKTSTDNAISGLSDTVSDNYIELDGKISDNATAINNHIANTSNPHEVTKAQVGLGNVDNTSDLNKPISTATQTALNGISGNLTDETNARIAADNLINADIDDIQDLIPNQASASNQLADKQFVNSAIQTNSAHFRGNWSTWANVPTDVNDYPADDDGNKTPTTNDYMVVQNASDYTGETLEGAWQFTYTGLWATNGKSGWQPRFQINESPLTPAEQTALDSGINQALVAQISTNQSNITGLQTSKQDAISDLSTIRSNAANGQSAYTTIQNYGNIVTRNADEFATASQGAKADSAIQTVKVNGSALTPDSNKAVDVTVPTNNNQLTNGAGYITSSAIANMQTTTNLVTSVSSSSTDSQYPSAKLFYDTCGDIETLINAL